MSTTNMNKNIKPDALQAPCKFDEQLGYLIIPKKYKLHMIQITVNNELSKRKEIKGLKNSIHFISRSSLSFGKLSEPKLK